MDTPRIVHCEDGKPWKVSTIKESKGWYKFNIQGLNHNYDPPQSFSWSVPDLDCACYDLTGAVRE